ncbi:MAG: helix-turn-helix domain-containing protein [Anaerolineales bacterium]
MRVHTKTVYRWVQNGTLRAFKFGPKPYRVAKRTLEQFIEDSRYGPMHNPPDVGPRQQSLTEFLFTTGSNTHTCGLLRSLRLLARPVDTSIWHAYLACQWQGSAEPLIVGSLACWARGGAIPIAALGYRWCHPIVSSARRVLLAAGSAPSSLNTAKAS